MVTAPIGGHASVMHELMYLAFEHRNVMFKIIVLARKLAQRPRH
jgi:hypothetical protein